MKHDPAFWSSSPGSSNDSLLVSLAITAVIHIMVIMGVQISKPEADKINRVLDITLVSRPAKKAPEKAAILAQDHQTGAGEKIQKALPAVPKSAFPSPAAEKRPGLTPQPSAMPVKTPPKKLVRPKAEIKTAAAPEPKKPHKAENSSPKAAISAASLKQQVAQLGAEILHAPQQNSDDAKIKFVNSVSAHKYLASQYTRDWELKVERTGNMNYPEIAMKKNFSATLIMDVGIKADGTIYSMRINKSSGNPALDEAAKRIVRMSAPFPPLPTELLKELNVLVITRIWKFSDESGLVAQ